MPEVLKNMVVHYAACRVDALWHRSDFQNLVEEKGEFAKALVGSMLSKRVLSVFEGHGL
ncbi:uncharacterized protein F5Z01DRAFT_660269 [Emericellopsis atlantica]|uniref:Uncharacterized protein n=1 Tax=Emericellopsis atlantica TaxID=2614577 RepID=A0A9P7ZIL1_9HYPO|nr:uncharacterized protein F5Z01DRAFT_660269 [Emericellopsis atlantica]KAG9252685.1 hypothetical protein F5Z01DRAFT_660269 [Emericellopsis atlantica]